MTDKKKDEVLCFIRYGGLYWRPKSCGYTGDYFEAGLYPLEDAQHIVGRKTGDTRNSRGDFYTPVKQHLADLNVTEATLETVQERIKYFRKVVMENDGWISVEKKMPKRGAVVMCRLAHYKNGTTQDVLLKRVNQDDCDWRTADDNSELNFDWNVTHWKPQTEKEQDNAKAAAHN